jgi:PKD repeat protein
MGRRFRLVLVFAGAVASGPACDEGTTTATPTLGAQCSAHPSSGPAPLTVAFVLDVAGAQGALSVAVNYGDGSQGTDPDQRHVYTAAGAYSASFTVSTATQTARCSAPVTVAATPTPLPTPRPEGNRRPVAVFKTTPDSSSTITGTAPFTVRFNMCPTVDPDDDRLYFRMDLDGNGAFEYHGSTGHDCRQSSTYAAGTRTATLCVTDVDCPSWPLCEGLAPLHPFQCRSYTIVATP